MSPAEIARLIEELQAVGDRPALGRALAARDRAERGSEIARLVAVEVQMIAEGGLHMLGRASPTVHRNGLDLSVACFDAFGTFAPNRRYPDHRLRA